MEALQYKIDQFEGPLDLLLTLISKSKINIEDIPISLICEQYMDFLRGAEAMDMEIASEFIVMASELMLIKSRMLLPRPELVGEDPRKQLTDALIRYQLAQAAAVKFAERYTIYKGRMTKDTDEISIDKTYVADQNPDALSLAIRRIKTYTEAMEKARKHAFTPMISKRVVSVELKIGGILRHMQSKPISSLSELIEHEETLPDLIAAFIGVLELIRTRRLLINDDVDETGAIHGLDTNLRLNTDESTILHEESTSISPQY